MSDFLNLPCDKCKGFCCGPVPVTKTELVEIKKYVKRQPLSWRTQLRSQLRLFGTCIFYDQDNNKCGIYPVRPSICKAFGHYKNMPCFQKPDVSSDKNYIVTEKPAGLLSADFVWKDFV